MSTFRRARDGDGLPTVDALSTALFRQPPRRAQRVTPLVAYFAHFIYLDLVHVGGIHLSKGEIKLAKTSKLSLALSYHSVAHTFYTGILIN